MLYGSTRSYWSIQTIQTLFSSRAYLHLASFCPYFYKVYSPKVHCSLLFLSLATSTRLLQLASSFCKFRTDSDRLKKESYFSHAARMGNLCRWKNNIKIAHWADWLYFTKAVKTTLRWSKRTKFENFVPLPIIVDVTADKKPFQLYCCTFYINYLFTTQCTHFVIY